MFQRALIPEQLREFLPYLSPNAFRVVPWSQLIKKSIGLVAAGRTAFDLDASTGISLCEKFPEGSVPLHSPFLTTEVRKNIGRSLLELYFRNVRASSTVSIDFRSAAFRWDSTGARLYWNPIRMALKWDTEFPKHAYALYEAYYSGNHSELRGTLVALGFIGPEESEGSLAQLIRLLDEHFGPGDQREVVFSSRKLAQTLHALFQELERRGSRLQPDFAFLGIMLATMTGTLEMLGCGLDARAAFSETRFPRTI
jgi:hypothetical protein